MPTKCFVIKLIEIIYYYDSLFVTTSFLCHQVTAQIIAVDCLKTNWFEKIDSFWINMSSKLKWLTLLILAIIWQLLTSNMLQVDSNKVLNLCQPKWESVIKTLCKVIVTVTGYSWMSKMIALFLFI